MAGAGCANRQRRAGLCSLSDCPCTRERARSPAPRIGRACAAVTGVPRTAPNWPRSRQHRQKRDVGASVERGQFEPFFQMRREALPSSPAAGSTRLFEDGDVAGAEAATLRDQPAIEMRDFGRSPSPSRKSPANSFDRACSRSRLSLSMPSLAAAVATSQPRRRNSHRDQARSCPPRFRSLGGPGSSRTPPQLAQAPAQLAPRVVRNIPQKLAQAGCGPTACGRQREIGEQRPHLARGRQLKRRRRRGESPAVQASARKGR